MKTISNQSDCCDKCHDVDYEKTYPAHTATFFCANKKCECHTPPNQEDVVKELKYILLDAGLKPIHFELNNSGVRILNTVRSLIAQAKQAGKQEVLNYLEQHGQGGGNWRRLIVQLRKELL